MASSTEEVSAPDLSAESRRNENDHFGVFKDFDFLEYESESVEVCNSQFRFPFFFKCRNYYRAFNERRARVRIISIGVYVDHH